MEEAPKTEHIAEQSEQRSNPPASKPVAEQDLVGASKSSEDTTATEGSSAGQAKKPKPQLESFEAFVTYFYSRKGRSVKLLKKDALRLGDLPLPEDEFFETELKELAGNDPQLAVPAQLFFSGLPHRQALPFWRKLERTYFVVLRHHPASAGLLPLLESARTAGEPAWSALEAVCDPGYLKSPPAVDSTKSLKKPELAKLQHNLLSNVTLWLIYLAKEDIDSVTRALHQNLWSTVADRSRNDIDRLKLILKLTDYGAAGLIGSSFESEVERLESDLHAAVGRESQLAAQLAGAQRVTVELQGNLDELRARSQQLENLIEENEKRYEASLTHAADDLERMRSRILRRIEDELELLDDGLAALRRNPPKTHVMEDHAERAISGLRNELRSLSSGSD